MKQQFDGNGIFPKGEKNEAYAQYFQGTSYLNMLSTQGVTIGNVVFEPGCRNHWHIHHKGGQILLVTGGRGWYQEWNQPARALIAGDVVNIPAGSSTGTARPPIAGLRILPLPSLPKGRLTNGWSRSPTKRTVNALSCGGAGFIDQ